MTTEYARLYQEITRRIVAAANPVKVILFGSRARGTAHPGSDVDLLVIERDPVSARQEATRLRQLLRDLEIPLDIIVVGQSFAERYGDIPGSVLYPALREGTAQSSRGGPVAVARSSTPPGRQIVAMSP